MLHIAASAKSTKSVEDFVENLVKFMERKDLELQNKDYYTALALAATVGNVKTSEIMLCKNSSLAEIPSNYGMLPLHMAAAYAHFALTCYLYENSMNMSGDFWTHEKRGQVLQKCVEANFFYVALKILKGRQELIAEKRLLMDVLLALAGKPRTFKGRKHHIIWRINKSVFAVVNVKVGPAEKQSEVLHILKIVWQKVAIMPKGEIGEIICGPPIKQGNVTQYPSRAPFLAVKSDNTRFIIELIRSNPEHALKLNDKGRTIFHEGVKCRKSRIYNLLYEIGTLKAQITRIKDKKGNTMLHLVAKCSNLKGFRYVSGVALQMQRELLWYFVRLSLSRV